MSTYCISDIHGNIDGFTELLSKIQLKKTTDKLYLLGDYVDCGPDSIGLILKIIDMQNKGYNIVALMGNHDLSFLDYMNRLVRKNLLSAHVNVGNSERQQCSENIVEYTEFIQNHTLSEYEQVIKWLNSLVYSAEHTCKGGAKYYLAHAFPETSHNTDILSMYSNNRKVMAVWHRLNYYDKPFETGDSRVLVFGHTPVCFMTPNWGNSKLSILKMLETNKIAIDCGGKAYGYDPRSRLAALRLEDLEEYYV